ncbi:Raptor N-terminal CASPase like domain containing protein, putative [Trypanosoma equiperdum]|uniref:Raptor N-terminal CASPase like domain containing protein, putative n=1 Tax=Trypanosoma equiperdum TaxID=5694 RepID=A0A1G4HZS9_TRYEQ|nr:Raptor N-terminal CASPase like domain containing protein, putative [Trypanosoma equiperdum]
MKRGTRIITPCRVVFSRLPIQSIMRNRRRVSVTSSTSALVNELLAAFAPHHLPSLSTGFDMGRSSEDIQDIDGHREWYRGGRGRRCPRLLLILCLNNGNDPPDFSRIDPCARLECWEEPYIARMPHIVTGGGSERIAALLQRQYHSQLQGAVSSMAVEVELEDAKKRMANIRLDAREELVVFHYNGHGMPRATGYGEIWMFDKKRTSYVPLSLAEMAEHLSSPTLYVFDCNSAGSLLKFWCEERLHETRPDDMFICACSAGAFLPLNPQLPADVLTSSLTTPLRMASEWYINFSHRKHLLPHVTAEMIRNVPGDISDERTPLGELQLILTAVTDIVAWCIVPSPLYCKLFRRDETTMVLFRNFLLADRLLREVGCVPQTHPPIPEEAHLHHAWDLWDYTLENVICQLPDLLTRDLVLNPNYTYKPSTFFEDQLMSFEVWLKSGDMREQPEELPSVLSALKRPQCCVAALTLLVTYLDSDVIAGKWAILCGILTHITSLLRNQELFLMASVLWMQVLRVDESLGTSELIKRRLGNRFIKVLTLTEKDLCVQTVERGQVAPLRALNNVNRRVGRGDTQASGNNSACPAQISCYLMEGVDLGRCKEIACYLFCQLLRHGGTTACVECWNGGLLNAAASLLESPSAEVRSWSCLVLAQLLFSLQFAKDFVSRKCTTHVGLFTHLLQDKSPIVRGSCVTLLSSLIGFRVSEAPGEHAVRRLQVEKTLLIKLRGMVYDASVIVRQELVLFACTVLFHYGPFLPSLQDTTAKTRYVVYMQEVGQCFPSWFLDEPDVQVKSMLNTSRPTANRCFNSKSVFENAPCAPADLTEPPWTPLAMDDIRSEDLPVLRGMVHDAALMLFGLYQACDKVMVTAALEKLGDNKRPESQRFTNESLRSMSSVVSANSTHFMSEAERARVTRNADNMQRIVLDLHDQKTEPPSMCTTAANRTRSLAVDGHSATYNANHSSGIPGAGDEKVNLDLVYAPHQILQSLLPCDQVICSTLRVLETAMVIATRNQYIYHVSYESYSVQETVHSFQVHLASPLHDILVINDASEQAGLLLVNQRGGYSLIRDCWEKTQGSPVEVAVFSACPPQRTVDIKSAYRSHNANLIYGGPIGYGGGTEIHILSLDEEQVIQQLKVSGDPTITSLSAHTTGRAVFAGCSDGLVRYYDDRQKQGFLGAVGSLRCGTTSHSPMEAVLGAGPVERDVAQLTIAMASRSAVYLYDTRKVNAPYLEVRVNELCDAVVPSSAAKPPPIRAFDAGTHTGMLGVLFADGTYTALNARGRPILRRAIQTRVQGPIFPGSLAVHPLRRVMSVGGEILVVH